MKTILLISLAILMTFLFSKHYYGAVHPTVHKAIALITPTKGNTVSGVVTFNQQVDGLHVNAQLNGLTPGNHGFHIHEFGNCACDDGVCAGDHYNPTNQPHAGPTSAHRHIGDLGNLLANENGKVNCQYIDKEMALNGPYSIIGRSVVVHEKEDDFTTQPSGNSGARIGIGVIGIAKN